MFEKTKFTLFTILFIVTLEIISYNGTNARSLAEMKSSKSFQHKRDADSGQESGSEEESDPKQESNPEEKSDPKQESDPQPESDKNHSYTTTMPSTTRVPHIPVEVHENPTKATSNHGTNGGGSTWGCTWENWDNWCDIKIGSAWGCTWDNWCDINIGSAWGCTWENWDNWCV